MAGIGFRRCHRPYKLGIGGRGHSARSPRQGRVLLRRAGGGVKRAYRRGFAFAAPAPYQYRPFEPKGRPEGSTPWPHKRISQVRHAAAQDTVRRSSGSARWSCDDNSGPADQAVADGRHRQACATIADAPSSRRPPQGPSAAGGAGEHLARDDVGRRVRPNGSSHVYAADRAGIFRDMARGLFGSVVPMQSHLSALAMSCIECSNDTEAFGVVPPPESDENARAWWSQLAPAGQQGPRIVAVLPLVGGKIEAYVVGTLDLEPTGEDTTLIRLEAESPSVSRAAIVVETGRPRRAPCRRQPQLHRRAPAFA